MNKLSFLNIVSFDECCGCGACANVCPRACITMKYDSMGFLHPYLDEAQCTHCNQCQKVCPLRNERSGKTEEAYISCKNRDDNVRRKSASGGLFYSLAQLVLEGGGIAYGAAFNGGCRQVNHVEVTTLKELPRLQGSKYIQSQTEGIFNKVLSQLKEGRRVLFSGTPCQVAALKTFLGQRYGEQLLTVDCVCHGVMSTAVYHHYLHYLEQRYQKTIKAFNFRDKTNGWHNSDITATFSDGRAFRQPTAQNALMRGFIKNIYTRPSCAQCRFKNLTSGSDLTLCDFWGSAELGRRYNDELGISIVSINTAAGRALFKAIKPALKGLKKVSRDLAYAYNESMSSSALPHEQARSFWKEYEQTDFDELIDRLAPYVPPAPIQPEKWHRQLLYQFKVTLYRIINQIRKP